MSKDLTHHDSTETKNPSEQGSETVELKPTPIKAVNSAKPGKALPDWQPLGSIRDYLTEHMRQDEEFR